ncbi:hypothetical protein J4211_01230 [Candidatus Woesearchaeota archaeon]|nr:hypothetical protein [Candidatus Woesearchaeota archaeon]
MVVSLIITRGEKTTDAFLTQLQKVSGEIGICVLLMRKYDEMVRLLAKKNIKSDGFLFVDGCSSPDETNMIHTSLDNLTLMSITINEAIQALPKERRFVAFDAFGTLALYNAPRVVAKFAFFLNQQVRELGMDCVWIVAREGLDPELLATLKQCADVIEG